MKNLATEGFLKHVWVFGSIRRFWSGQVQGSGSCDPDADWSLIIQNKALHDVGQNSRGWRRGGGVIENLDLNFLIPDLLMTPGGAADYPAALKMKRECL